MVYLTFFCFQLLQLGVLILFPWMAAKLIRSEKFRRLISIAITFFFFIALYAFAFHLKSENQTVMQALVMCNLTLGLPILLTLVSSWLLRGNTLFPAVVANIFVAVVSSYLGVVVFLYLI